MDVDPKVQAAIKALAIELGTTESQLYNYFTARGLQSIDWSDLRRRLKAARGIRYKHNIDLDDLLDNL